jgi:GxxExxY protein
LKKVKEGKESGNMQEKASIDEITHRTIGAAIEVHKALGPGLLESVYEQCLCHEFDLRRIPYERQLQFPVVYKGINVDCGYRLDVLVENQVVIEIKAVDELLPVHKAQLLTYMKLGGWKAGLLINFNVPILIQGVHRLVNHLEEPHPSP